MEPTTSINEVFHSIKHEYQIRAIDAALLNETISLRDAQLIREFIAERRSCVGISVGRANKLVFTLLGWRRFIGEFSENTIADLYAGVPALRSGLNLRGRPFKQNTISDYVAILKQFYLWLIENEYSFISEKKLRKLQTPRKDPMTKTASALLTPDEVRAMIKACNRSMDRAIITMLYEGGFRVGEIGTMRWGDIKFDHYGVIVNVNFKTGIPRYVRIIMGKEYLAQWRHDYPGIAEGDALVFLNRNGKPLTHAMICKQLERLAERARVTKHITPHLFRHSRITHLIQEGVSESVIKLMMWGSINSKMFQTYAHLTGSDIDSELLQVYGISANVRKGKDSRLEPRQCAHCQTINSPIANYCVVCGHSFTEEAENEEEKIRNFILNNPEALKEFIERLMKESAQKTF